MRIWQRSSGEGTCRTNFLPRLPAPPSDEDITPQASSNDCTTVVQPSAPTLNFLGHNENVVRNPSKSSFAALRNRTANELPSPCFALLIDVCILSHTSPPQNVSLFSTASLPAFATQMSVIARTPGSTRRHVLSSRATGREHSAWKMARHEHSSPVTRHSSPMRTQVDTTSERVYVREERSPGKVDWCGLVGVSSMRTWRRTSLVSQCRRASLPRKHPRMELGSAGSCERYAWRSMDAGIDAKQSLAVRFCGRFSSRER